jgi:hypothetical protein
VTLDSRKMQFSIKHFVLNKKTIWLIRKIYPTVNVYLIFSFIIFRPFDRPLYSSGDESVSSTSVRSKRQGDQRGERGSR